jgi:hypothetical protein
MLNRDPGPLPSNAIFQAIALPQMFANMYLRFCQVQPLMKHLLTLDTHGPPLAHHTIRLAIGETHRRLGPAQYSLRMLLSRMPNLQVLHAPKVLIPLATLEILSEHPHLSLTELIICVQTGDPRNVLIMTGVAKLTRLRRLEVTIIDTGQPQGWNDVLGQSADPEPPLDHVEHLRWTIHGDFTPPEWSSWLWRTRFPSLRTFGISVGDDPKWDVASYLRAFLDAHRSVRELFVLGSARLSASVLGMRTSATTVHLLAHSGLPTSFTEWAPCTRTLVIHAGGATPDNDHPPTRESLFALLTCILACETSGSIGALRTLRLHVWCHYETRIEAQYGYRAPEEYRILWANLAHLNSELAGDILRLIQLAERFQALGVRVLDANGLPAPVQSKRPVGSCEQCSKLI